MNRTLKLLLLFCLPVSCLHAKTNLASQKKTPSKTIAVYNVDSVMAVMPEYAAALREFTRFDSLVNLQDSLMDAEYRRKIMAYAVDSVKFSPIIRELKKREIEYLGERISQFRQQVFTDLESKKKNCVPRWK